MNLDYNKCMTSLEVIASTVKDARAAQAGGAGSLEICVDLKADGLTPPLALVKAIRDAVTIDLNVMVRPHNKSFVYDEADRVVIFETAAAFKALGIQTMVFGAHQPDGSLDLELIKAVAEAAKPVPLTLHRAIERSTNPEEGLMALTGVVQRVLTSGPAKNAPDGMIGLLEWVNYFGMYYQFAAAGGIRKENLQAIARTTGVDQIHIGSAAQENGAVSESKVQELVRLLHSS